ncbi:MAG: hypothetical protein AAGA54_35900 [Myxococcota bacterium]
MVGTLKNRERSLCLPLILAASIACVACDSGSTEEQAKPGPQSPTPTENASAPDTAKGDTKCGISDYAQVEAELRTVAEKAAKQCKTAGSLPSDGVFEGDRSKFSWAAMPSDQSTTYEMVSNSGTKADGMRLTCYAADCTCGPIMSKSLAGEYEALEEASTMLTLHGHSGSIVGGAPNGPERLLQDHAKKHPNGELASVREAYRRRFAKLWADAGKPEPSIPASTPSSHALQCALEDREDIEATLLEMSKTAIGKCKETGSFPLQGVFAGDDKKYMWFAQASGGRALYDVQKLGADTASGLRQACYEDGCACDPPIAKTLDSEYSWLEGALDQLLIKEAGNDPIPSDSSRLEKAERALDRHARDFPKGALSAVRERYRRDLAKAKKAGG